MFEILNKYHDRTGFDCGNTPINTYLKTMANQHAKKLVDRRLMLALNKIHKEQQCDETNSRQNQ